MNTGRILVGSPKLGPKLALGYRTRTCTQIQIEDLRLDQTRIKGLGSNPNQGPVTNILIQYIYICTTIYISMAMALGIRVLSSEIHGIKFMPTLIQFSSK